MLDRWVYTAISYLGTTVLFQPNHREMGFSFSSFCKFFQRHLLVSPVQHNDRGLLACILDHIRSLLKTTNLPVPLEGLYPWPGGRITTINPVFLLYEPSTGLVANLWGHTTTQLRYSCAPQLSSPDLVSPQYQDKLRFLFSYSLPDKFLVSPSKLEECQFL